MTTDTLTVVEGGDSGDVLVTSNFSPEYFCEDRLVGTSPESCVVAVFGYVEVLDSDLTCYESGVSVAQAVVGYDATYELEDRRSCGLYLHTYNWIESLRIPVYAMIDGVVDGEQSRTLHIHHQIEHDTVAVSDAELKTIAVSLTFNSNSIHYPTTH